MAAHVAEGLSEPAALTLDLERPDALLQAPIQPRDVGEISIVVASMSTPALVDAIAARTGQALQIGRGTALRKSNVRLEAERQRLADVLSATAAGVWEWNVSTGEVRFCERWAQQIGRSVASLGHLTVQNTWMALAHPDDLTSCMAALQAHFAGETDLYEAEFRMRHSDGRWVWILGRGTVKSRLPDGSPEWMLGTHVDISGVKDQEAQLRRTQTLLARIGEIAAICGFELCMVSGQLELSSQARRRLGLPVEGKIRWRTALALLGAQERRRLLKAVAEARCAGSSWHVELALCSGLGGSRTMQVTGQQELHDGRLRMLGAVQDVTERARERRHLEGVLRRLQAANLAGGVGSWSHDFRSGETYCDPLLRGMLGLKPADRRPLLRGALAVIHAEDRDRVMDGYRRAIRLAEVHEDEWRICLADGSFRVLHGAAIIERAEGGRATSVTGAVWDVTKPRQLELEFAQHRALLQVTLNTISDAILTADSSGAIQWMNEAARSLLALPSGPPAVLFDQLQEDIRRCVDFAHEVASAEGIVLHHRQAPTVIEYLCSPIVEGGKRASGAVVVIRDVTEQRIKSDELVWQANHDALTGLANRAAFDVQLRGALAKAKAKAGAGGQALLYLDLDQFKLVNDACGHLVGDQLLKEVATVVMGSVRSADTVARVGGDEFAVILAGCNTEQASRAAQGICHRLNDYRFEWGGRRFRIGASIGLVPIDERWQDADEILKAADSACYAAKDAGRNRVHTWLESDQSLRERSGEMQWASLLEQALDEHRFVLFGQKIAPLKQGDDRLHVELLLRMQTSQGQLVLPGSFMPAAERYDLASRIDRRVIEMALSQLQGLHSPDGIGLIGINLSGKSVSDPLFREVITELLVDVPVALRQRLCMEITETSAVTSLPNARALIKSLAALEVSVALDDFGAGASSFGYLRELSVDWLKIDGRYVRNLLTDPLDMAAVKCFVEVARVSGVRTVAEFVDSQDVIEELQRLGVDCAQGYLVHRPEPLRDLLDAFALSARSPQ